MIRARSYRGDAAKGSIVVRIVRSGDDIVGFIREVEEPGDTDSVYPSEPQPIEEVWRLVRNKLEIVPDAPVYVELEAGIEWQAGWGSLDGPAHTERTQ